MVVKHGNEGNGQSNRKLLWMHNTTINLNLEIQILGAPQLFSNSCNFIGYNQNVKVVLTIYNGLRVKVEILLILISCKNLMSPGILQKYKQKTTKNFICTWFLFL